jgi:hypothetical protein
VDGEFHFAALDVAAITEALGAIKSGLEPGMEENKVINEGRSSIGIFNDMGTIIDKDHKRAGLLKIVISCHWMNMQEALAGLRDAQKAVLQTGLSKAMSDVKDVSGVNCDPPQRLS